MRTPPPDRKRADRAGGTAGFTAPVVVLLTSTLRPAGCTPATAAQRRRQYEQALESWMLDPDPRIAGIVYCDNSEPHGDRGPDRDLAWVEEIAARTGSGRKLEALHCGDNHIPPGMHYGYAELAIIDHALAGSRLMRSASHFAKATGRLRFPGFRRLLDRLPADFGACIDYRDAYRSERRLWADHRARTQLMLFGTEFYRQHLYGQRWQMVANGISHIEEFIPALIRPRQPDCADVVFRWPVPCEPSGISGDGLRYDSRRRRLKRVVSSLSRRVAPWLWL